MSPILEDKSLRNLLADLVREVSILFRQEIALARAELSEDLSRLTSGAASVAIGGAVAFAGLLFLLACATLALANVVAPWLAALIVGGTVSLVGLALLIKGRSDLRMNNLVPHRTIESVHHAKRLAKEHMS